MPSPGNFDLFVGIDWSGARGAAHKGLAVAAARPGQAAPRLIAPEVSKYWSRTGVLEYLRGQAALGLRVLAGIDCSFSLPYEVTDGFFPHTEASPKDAEALWALVEDICTGDDDFYAGKFVEPQNYGAYFRRVGARGVHFSTKLRVTESQCAAQGLARAVPTFNLIGANQVGLASLSAMRLFHHLLRLEPAAAIWPMVGSPKASLVMVEIYSRLFLTLAGAPYRKIRQRGDLARALAAFGSEAPLNTNDLTAGNHPDDTNLTDHATDALVTVAGLRALVQSGDAGLWSPRLLAGGLARREGWTFGVR